MKTIKPMTFKQIILLLSCLFFSMLPLFSSAQLSGQITSVQDSDGNELGDNAPEKGEVYTIAFTGNDIKDFHLKLGTDTATVCFHEGAMPAEASGCDIDILEGDFDDSGTHTEDGGHHPDTKYISLWRDEPITSGSFKIRINEGTPGKAPSVVFTSDGNSIPFDGGYAFNTPVDDVSGVPTLISTEVIPTLSEWGVIILILLTLSVGMVFLYRKQKALALAGNMPTGTSTSKSNLFDKRLYAKVFGAVLLIGFALLGLSFLYFGEITSADPIGVFVSSAVVAYMVHFWILKKSQSE